MVWWLPGTDVTRNTLEKCYLFNKALPYLFKILRPRYVEQNLLDRFKVTLLNPSRPLLQPWLVVCIQVSDQVPSESSHTLTRRCIRNVIHFVAPGTDPYALRSIPPVILIQIRRGYHDPHRTVVVPEQHHLGVVRRKGRAHLYPKRSYVLPDGTNFDQFWRIVTVQYQHGFLTGMECRN